MQIKLNVIITGSTGMVGKGALLECLDSSDVESVLVLNRKTAGIQHVKLKEILLPDFEKIDEIKHQLTGYNACFYCLGVSSVGISKEAYEQITYTLTKRIADVLLSVNPDMTFCFVSGLGTDSSEKSRTHWANIKGKTENTLLQMAFRNVFLFRPGFIQPLKGIQSKTKLYQFFIVLFKPVFPLLKWLFPNQITTTTVLGKAMIKVVVNGYDKTYLYNRDMNAIAGPLRN